MKYYLIAGEASGDLHGSNLMKGILKADPGARFRFWGGDKMAAVGGAENLAMHYEKASFMGFTEVLKNLRTIFGQIEQCKRDVAAYAPDVPVSTFVWPVSAASAAYRPITTSRRKSGHGRSRA